MLLFGGGDEGAHPKLIYRWVWTLKLRSRPIVTVWLSPTHRNHSFSGRCYTCLVGVIVSVLGVHEIQFADIKADDEDTSNCGRCDYYPGTNNCYRPGGENHKGMIDFWRRPKLSYNLTQALFRKYGR